MKLTKLPDGYNSIDITPPELFLDVIDENGVTGIAYPTFYPFKMVDRKPVSCPKYWDGGWMIEYDFSEKMTEKICRIIGWRKLDKIRIQI